jgi:hypothetical protein
MTPEALASKVEGHESEITNLKRRVAVLESMAKGKAPKDVQDAAKRGFGEGHGGGTADKPEAEE